MIKHPSVLVLFVCATLLSCNRPNPNQIIVGELVMDNRIVPEIPIHPKVKFKFSNLDLYTDISELNKHQFKKYGTFYTKDFTIYQVNDLDLLQDNLYIGEIYLYYIDNKLHKIQAFTTKNMADFFLSKYGGAKLILKDRFNKKLAMTEGAVFKKYGKTKMNKNLTNYKLKWSSEDRVISYLIDESGQKNFEALGELIHSEEKQHKNAKPSYVFTIQSQNYNSMLSRIKLEETILAKNK